MNIVRVEEPSMKHSRYNYPVIPARGKDRRLYPVFQNLLRGMSATGISTHVSLIPFGPGLYKWNGRRIRSTDAGTGRRIS
ncbi:MAG: hypothetical protein MI975_17485 [Cytophagales bacterium]|nr:hypothetical protein [Cytophagales bacterium]